MSAPKTAEKRKAAPDVDSDDESGAGGGGGGGVKPDTKKKPVKKGPFAPEGVHGVGMAGPWALTPTTSLH
jgi:hypothetical protein